MYDFTRVTFRSAFDRADVVADEVNGYLIEHLNVATETSGTPPTSVDQLKESWTETIRTDRSIRSRLERTLANAKLVLSIRVTDTQGQVLAASDARLMEATSQPARDFREIQNDYWFANLWRLMTRSENYSTTRSLGVNNKPLFLIEVVIRSDFVRNDIEPALEEPRAGFRRGAVYRSLSRLGAAESGARSGGTHEPDDRLDSGGTIRSAGRPLSGRRGNSPMSSRS